MQGKTTSQIPPPLRYYSRREAAPLIHVSESSLDMLRRTGQIKGICKGRRVFFSEEELDRYMRRPTGNIWPPKQNGKTTRHCAPVETKPSKESRHFSGQRLVISEAQHKALAAAYEGADLEAEYRKMDAWLVTNKRNYRNFGRFANSWLNNMRIPQDRRPSHEYRTIKQRIIEAREAQERERSN
jgi:hypothetical protein